MSVKNSFFKSTYAVGALLLAGGLTSAWAEEAANYTTLEEAIGASTPILDVRLRYEGVDQDGVANEADALTIRARAGFETGKFFENAVLIEVEAVQDIVGDFNSTTNGKGSYPVVADPNDIQLNRFQIVNTFLPKTKLTLGRQRIILDNARFVGNVGWRQNEQTFDAFRVENETVPGLKLDISYIKQVNRIFGTNSAMGKWKGDSVLVNGKYKVPVEIVDASVSGFVYLLDNETAPAAASKTFGGSVTLAKGPVELNGTYATQSEYKGQPVSYDADYYDVNGTFSYKGASVGAGYEVLEGDGTTGFATPLATLHAFNGWADVFLTTPANGIEDLYVTASYAKKDVGPFNLVKVLGAYHDFSAENTGADYGKEFDIVALAKYKKFTFLAKYADYQTDGFATDRNKLWFEVNYSF